jgi:serine/tyrosine/threonine adenylyltransferase
MPGLHDLRFDNRYARLGPAFHEVVDPTPLPGPRLVAFNPAAARLLDLNPAVAGDPEFVRLMAGHGRLAGAEPVAALYAGHQFGVWVPRLGDGRAILLGEVVNRRGERWDLHLKGAGRTRFSRMGDGRSVLRSAIREYLAGEALHALGIPTTRALCVVGSDEVVQRELPETAATLLRLAPSHVRFGTFQAFAARGQPERVRELADFVIALYFPELPAGPGRHAAWFAEVVRRTARLVADWMAMGFTHGVLNTDNMSVLGLTLDYGPYGFLDDYDPGHVANHSDHEGRYAFGHQPAVGLWNVARFGEALLSLMTVEEADAALAAYPAAFQERYLERMRGRLGLAAPREEDAALVAGLLELLAAARIDYTRFFRALCDVPADAGPVPEALLALGGPADATRAWLDRYRARVRAEGVPDPDRRAAMRGANPKFVLRNHLAQQAIDAARQGDYGPVDLLREVLETPFDEHPAREEWAGPPPAWARELVVSCSS